MNQESTQNNTEFTKPYKACILNHARRRPHEHAFLLDDGPTIFVAILRPH
jgi:hypothetical protein